MYMCNQFTESSKNILLELYNKIWKKWKLPHIWKKAVVVPIHKPQKDCTKPVNYRPTALTSNICM